MQEGDPQDSSLGLLLRGIVVASYAYLTSGASRAGRCVLVVDEIATGTGIHKSLQYIPFEDPSVQISDGQVVAFPRLPLLQKVISEVASIP